MTKHVTSVPRRSPGAWRSGVLEGVHGFPTNGGVAFPRVIVHYSTGQEEDATAVAELSWDLMDALAQINAVFTGLSNSPVTIQAVYGGKTNSIAATVRAPSYTVSSGAQWNPVGGVVSIDGTNSVSVPIG